MRARLLTAALVLASGALPFVPLAQAGTTTTDLTADAEGWYQPNPSCPTPAGCVGPGALPVAPPAEPPTSPFPARTLHVGMSAGQETARAYLAFPLFSLEGTLTSAKLSVPLDLAPSSGSVAPETAKAVVCATIGTVVDVDGAITEPPVTDCGIGAPLTYVATPQPHLEADLTSIAGDLASATGLALLPDASKAQQTDNWRLVFSARNRADAGKTAPATLAVTLETADPPSDGGAGLPEPPSPDPGFGAVAPPVGTGFAPSPPTAPPAPAVSVPTARPLPPAPTAAPRLVTVGYRYPAVWLLPLVFLVLVPAIGRALTKDLAPALPAQS